VNICLNTFGLLEEMLVSRVGLEVRNVNEIVNTSFDTMVVVYSELGLIGVSDIAEVG
jgi:hypothetical protein